MTVEKVGCSPSRSRWIDPLTPCAVHGQRCSSLSPPAQRRRLLAVGQIGRSSKCPSPTQDASSKLDCACLSLQTCTRHLPDVPEQPSANESNRGMFVDTTKWARQVLTCIRLQNS